MENYNYLKTDLKEEKGATAMQHRRKVSLKIRIFIVFSGLLFLMLASYLFTVSRFITRFTTKQLNDDYNALLTEVCDTMQSLLWNLTLTSGQILDNTEIEDSILGYQSALTPYIRQEHYASLLNDITMLTLANTDLSLLYLYDNTDQSLIFSSFPVSHAVAGELPVLYANSAFVFYGPCSSQSSYNGNPVLILNRTEQLPNGTSVTLSMESGFYSMQKPIQAVERKSAFLAITNADGNLIYTDFSDELSRLPQLAENESNKNKYYRAISKEMSQGWRISIVIPNQIYIRDYYHSLRDVALCTLLIATFVIAFALYFWKSIYAPLQLFDRQIEQLLDDSFDASLLHSAIPEYEYLLRKVSNLQRQIQDMIHKIIHQEQLNTKIQTEKLRAQINPHFLLNTLNTLHWMALMNDQPEIDSITQSLSHLLSYNLDKQNSLTNLDRELAALQEYVQLQRVRYDFHFEILRPENGDPLNYPTPKFLLQPLVENALSHGYRPGMDIRIQIQVDEQIRITVSDTGSGITPKLVESINHLAKADHSADEPAEGKPAIPRFGIGLSYVIRSLHEFFPENCTFHISGEENKGTVILIEMPKQKGVGYHAENTDH